MKHLKLGPIVVAILLLLSGGWSFADYLIKDGDSPPATKTVKAGSVGGNILPESSLTDPSGVPLLNSGQSAPINLVTQATTQLVGAVNGNSILVTSWDVMDGAAETFQLVYGTGSNCASGQQALTGPYPMIAQAGIAKGNGAGVILRVPQGNALCAVKSQAVQSSGSVSYIQGPF